jgi:hypothetical protein
MTLGDEDLNETDEGIVQMLQEGRCTPRYIAKELDRQQPYINQRLKRLVEHDHVERVDRGLYELASDPRADRGAGVQESPPQVDRADTHVTPEESPDSLEEDLAALDLPRPRSSDVSTEDRREAVRAAYEFLRDQRAAMKKEFKPVYESHPAGYGSFGGWWNGLVDGKNGYDALRDLAERRGDIEPASEDTDVWKWVGDDA